MPAIRKLRIYDMDGTIVCSLHRYKTVTHADGIERIDLTYWRENEYRALDDSLLPAAEQYKADLLADDTFVVIATARVLNAPDRQFIRDILGQPDHIISRAANDTRSGGLLKVLGLKKLLNLKQFADIRDVLFYEDNVTYLKTVCDFFGITGVYVPSKQGH
jgi:hypothetical protein